MSDPTPRRRIELLQTLGQGGFGSVYLADVYSREDFVQRLAVKVLSVEMSADADVAARQRDEARLLARLNHDHIVRVMDLTELDGRPAVLMEYVEGVDCAELLRKGALPVKAAVQICAAAASALDAAWSSPGLRGSQPLRVIHRDIKPANLLVSVHGGVKVLDFGIARADFEREGKTGSVQFGTARFMAPEQWLLGASSNKVDIYALGVTLVEISTGMHMERAPLDEAAFNAHMEAVREAVLDSRWPLAFRQGLDRLLSGMLAFSPEARPDAGEAYEALAHLADLAPDEALIRWARRTLPPMLEEQRQRWAAVPPPQLGEGPLARLGGGAPPAPEEPAPLRPSTSGGRTVLSRPNPGPPDTLASSRQGASSLHGASSSTQSARWRRPIVPLVSGLTAALILILGAFFLVPRLLPAPVEQTAELVAEPPVVLDALAEDAPVEPAPVEPAPVEAAPVEAAPAEPAPAEPQQPAAEPAAARSSPRRASVEPAAPSPPVEQVAPAAPAVVAPSASAGSSPASAAAEPPAVATFLVNLASEPWGAQVVIDGKTFKNTPLYNLPLTAGKHTISMALDGASITRTITVGGRNPTVHTWNKESNVWRSE